MQKFLGTKGFCDKSSFLCQRQRLLVQQFFCCQRFSFRLNKMVGFDWWYGVGGKALFFVRFILKNVSVNEAQAIVKAGQSPAIVKT